MKFSFVRTAMILIVALVGIVTVLPNFVDEDTLAGWPGFLPTRQVVLGLDLQGGSQLLLQVNREEIVEGRLADVRREARSVLIEAGIGSLISTDGTTLRIELTDPSQAEAAREALAPLEEIVVQTSTMQVGGTPEVEIATNPDNTISITLTEAGIASRMSSLVGQSLEVIRSRIDELGTTEPVIQRQGNDRILVEVPGVSDSERLKDLISQTARLTFHLVYPSMSAAQAEAQGLPPGTMIVPSADGFDELIYEDVALGGEQLVDAQPAFDQNGQPVVSFRFNTQGALTFGEITSENVGRRFAIVLDNQVITAPTIQQPITGGTGQISGNFTAESASDLAVLLRAGALPATLDVIEERSIGPSLGADSVRGGVVAGIIAGLSTVVFMLIAYGTFGVFANIALILNVVLIVAALSTLGATLTLPGIAGIVLTMGMAVDANVLIFERIREEAAAGRTIVQSLEAGFSNAMSAILDSNITTFIAAAVLFFLGSGPVQGFAVTLAIGILTTLFTAYFITLFIVGRWYAWKRPKRLRVQLAKFIPDNTKIPFMNWRKAAIGASIVLSIASLGLFAVNGLNLGIDFKGGSLIEAQSLEGPAEPGVVREALGELNLGDVQVQGFGTPQDILIRIELQEGDSTTQQTAVDQVTEALADENYQVRRVEAVSGTVSGELALSSTIGLSVAVLGILIYLWFRFEWQFAVGAVLSTLHDVILTLGFFAITGIEFNLSSIAAILTIVGYSLNDTVVVYDRIREYARKYRSIPLAEMLNMSINSTLSRTVLTGPTTLLALLALAIFGGEVIQSFVLSMIFGVVVGTYSSIFISAPLLLYMGIKTRAEAEPLAQKPEKRADGAAV